MKTLIKPFLKIPLLVYFLFLGNLSFGQSLGIGTTVPNINAVLEVNSTTKGLLIPRVVLTSTTAAAPLGAFVAGMLVYNTASVNDVVPGYYGTYGSKWIRLDDGLKTLSIFGNDQTNFTTDFIGTTDDNDVVFRRSNIRAGILSTTNTSWGNGALNPASVIFNNTAVGSNALESNTSGGDNTALGFSASKLNTQGSNNTSVGYFAQRANTTSFDNTVIGAQAGNNLTGGDNVFIGNQAGNSETAVNEKLFINNAVGDASSTLIYGEFDTDRVRVNNMVGIGLLPESYPLEIKAIGANESVMRLHDRLNVPKWDINVASGELQFNETNVTKTLHLNYDVGIGMAPANSALTIKAAGTNNNLIKLFDSANVPKWELGLNNDQHLSFSATGVGNNRLVITTGGKTNGSVGINHPNPTGDFHIKQSNESYTPVGTTPSNTSGGLKIERVTTSDSWNILTDFGGDLNFNFNGVTKGYLDNTNGNFATLSDKRLKKNIRPLEPVLDKVLRLSPKVYNIKNNKQGIVPDSYGFIAQEVEEIFPSFVYTKGTHNIKGIAYQNFSIVAIQAIKEQQEKISENQKFIEDREKNILENDSKIKNLEALLQKLTDKQTTLQNR